jgi:hypothetical protein
MRVNKAGVPPDKQNDSRLLAFEQDALLKMQDKHHRLIACAHEAAHAFYMRRAGYQKITLHGPQAIYDNASDAFMFLSLAISRSEPTHDITLGMVAKYAVAGSVFEYTQTTSHEKNVEKKDKDDFLEIAIRDYPPMPSDELAAVWLGAKAEVEKDLRSHVIKAEIWKLAREYDAQLMNDEAK